MNKKKDHNTLFMIKTFKHLCLVGFHLYTFPTPFDEKKTEEICQSPVDGFWEKKALMHQLEKPYIENPRQKKLEKKTKKNIENPRKPKKNTKKGN